MIYFYFIFLFKNEGKQKLAVSLVKWKIHSLMNQTGEVKMGVGDIQVKEEKYLLFLMHTCLEVH